METVTLEKLESVMGDSVKPAVKGIEALLERFPKDESSPKADASQNGSITMGQIQDMAGKGGILREDGSHLTMAELQQEVANMDQFGVGGLASSLDRAVRGLPLGSALVGGFTALLVGEAVDGFVDPVGPDGKSSMANAAVKVGVAWAGSRFFSRFLGSTGATVFAGLLVFEVLREFLPVNQWVSQITGAFPAGNRLAFAGPAYNGYQEVLPAGASAGLSNVIPAHHGAISQFDTIFS